MGAYKKKMCLGYVVRNPFNKGLGEALKGSKRVDYHTCGQGKAQCWLIHGDAKPSESFPDEVKIAPGAATC